MRSFPYYFVNSSIFEIYSDMFVAAMNEQGYGILFEPVLIFGYGSVNWIHPWPPARASILSCPPSPARPAAGFSSGRRSLGGLCIWIDDSKKMGDSTYSTSYHDPAIRSGDPDTQYHNSKYLMTHCGSIANWRDAARWAGNFLSA